MNYDKLSRSIRQYYRKGEHIYLLSYFHFGGVFFPRSNGWERPPTQIFSLANFGLCEGSASAVHNPKVYIVQAELLLTMYIRCRHHEEDGAIPAVSVPVLSGIRQLAVPPVRRDRLLAQAVTLFIPDPVRASRRTNVQKLSLFIAPSAVLEGPTPVTTANILSADLCSLVRCQGHVKVRQSVEWSLRTP